MKNETLGARLERLVATLETIAGLIETRLAALPPRNDQATDEPPDTEAEKEIDAFVKKRLEEIEYERETKQGYALGD